jgi:hypothetical protein
MPPFSTRAIIRTTLTAAGNRSSIPSRVSRQLIPSAVCARTVSRTASISLVEQKQQQQIRTMATDTPGTALRFSEFYDTCYRRM